MYLHRTDDMLEAKSDYTIVKRIMSAGQQSTRLYNQNGTDKRIVKEIAH